jgi:hypothetical protein
MLRPRVNRNYNIGSPSNMVARIAMMAMITSNSINMNARKIFIGAPFYSRNYLTTRGE